MALPWFFVHIQNMVRACVRVCFYFLVVRLLLPIETDEQAAIQIPFSSDLNVRLSPFCFDKLPFFHKPIMHWPET